MELERFLRDHTRPDPAFSPVPLWWWSGEKLEIGRMKWQMDRLHGMGIRNICQINLAPNGTMFGSDADDPPFLSDAWWEIFTQVCDHARAIGMSVWFYDQIGFSGASYQADIARVHPEYLAHQLRYQSVEGTGDLKLTFPATGTPIAAYVVSGSDANAVQYLPLSSPEVAFHAAAPSKLAIVYSVRQAYDLFSADACDKLLDAVHREFERRLPQHLGTTIVGSFQDELPDLPTWGPTFAQTFAAKHGYSLEAVIHRLFEPGDAASRRTRVQYHAHRADLAEEAFFKPFFDWHEQRNLACGFDQQSPAREARLIGCVAKYADYVRTHRWFGIPGSDLHGNGKLHASIAWMYDRKRVWIEGFHSTGWGGTIADTFDWCLPYMQQGANLYNPHAVYYGTRYGWWEWAPPSTCFRQPYAMHYRPFAEMICRLTKVISAGVQQASVGVLFPTATVQSAMGPTHPFDDAAAADRTLHEIIGSVRWHEAKDGVMDQLSLDYLILDEPTLHNADLQRDALVHRDTPIRTLILPHVTFASDATVDRLAAFAANGGRLIAVGSAEIETPVGRRIDLRAMRNVVCVDSPAQLAEALSDAPRLITSPVNTLHRKAGGVHVVFVPAVTGMATRVEWSWGEPLLHSTIVPERYRNSAEVTLHASVRGVAQFDPWTGKATPLPAVRTADGVKVHIDFADAPMAVLVCSETDDLAAETPQAGEAREAIALPEEWSVRYLPTLPTEYVDTFDPAEPALRLPHTTDFRWIAGGDGASFHRGLPDSAEIVRATFGPRAWRTDAGRRLDLPVSYSPRFGIVRDPVYHFMLGPKGHVPEEFIDLGRLNAGQTTVLHTGVVVPADQSAVLAIGANAIKRAIVNGTPLSDDDGSYLWTAPVELRRGENKIELHLKAEVAGNVRLFWCLLRPDGVAAFRRPDRIEPNTPTAAGALLRFRRRFALPAYSEGMLKVSVDAIALVKFDGQLLGRQGGFDPYHIQMRGQTYRLDRVAAGEHEIEVEVVQTPNGSPATIDALFRSGEHEVSVVSDLQWTVSVDDGPALPVRARLRQDIGGSAWHLYRRPHPLPGTLWLEKLDAQSERPSPVLDLPLVPPASAERLQWLEWTLPPGAIGMSVPLAAGHGQAWLWIDGQPAPISDAGHVDLSAGPRGARRAVLSVYHRQLGGGLLDGPVRYELSTGELHLGAWESQGLRSYSGAVEMTTTVKLPATAPTTRATLNLRRVRGTVEAFLDGGSLGIRCMSPYRFELPTDIAAGEHTLSLVVTNTLGNHYSSWAPTHGWSPDQLESGVTGPASIDFC
jgi:hypothetical protein